MDISEPIIRAFELCARFDLEGDQTKVRAPEPLPQGLLCELRLYRREITSNVTYESRPKASDCSVLAEWHLVSIPQCRLVLRDSRLRNDHRLAEYARWMLRDVLLDPEYQEDQT